MDVKAEGQFEVNLRTGAAKRIIETLPSDRGRPPTHVDTLQVVHVAGGTTAGVMVANQPAEGKDATNRSVVCGPGLSLFVNHIPAAKTAEIWRRCKMSLDAFQPVFWRVSIVIGDGYDVSCDRAEREVERLHNAGNLDDACFQRKLFRPFRRNGSRRVVSSPEHDQNLIRKAPLSRESA